MKLKNIISGAFDAILSSYEGKRFWPSLILRLVMALASAVITAVFANTLFSKNNIANQVFAALFFYFLMVSISKLITEIKRGGVGGRLKTVFGNMVRLTPPTLWFFLAAVIIALFLPYAFVLSLALLLFMSAVSGENSMLLGMKNAVTKGKHPERNGKGLAGFACGLIACGLVVCILFNLGVPTLYGAIDGESPKNDTTQTAPTDDTPSNADTPSDTDTVPDDKIAKTDSDEVIVSGDTDIKEAAGLLTDKLIAYAGSDRKAFEKLFRNTESTVIDQYYNTSYDTFKAYGKSLIAIAAQEGDAVWFTALYYQIPANYPAEKEKSVYLSTIMTRKDDGWKLEWNEDVRAKLQSAYTTAGSTYAGREAMEQGYAWAKFFIPFDMDETMLYYDDAVMCKVMEMYMDINNNLQITLYVSNGTDTHIGLARVNMTVTDNGAQLFSKSFDMDLFVDKHNVTYYTLTIPSEELDFTTWDSPVISDFSFDYDVLDN